MKGEPFFIDTNIVMYARGKGHPYKASCAQIIFEIAAGSFQEKFGTPVTDTEVFQEILYRYALLGRWETGILVCQDFLTLGLEVLPIESREVKRLIELAKLYQGKGIPPRDLIHLAVMLNHGIRKIISADAHFDLVEEVARLDPVALSSK